MMAEFRVFLNFLLIFYGIQASTLDVIQLLKNPIEPEALMSVVEIIKYWGYPVEEHHVVTDDGYILTLHRIPHGKNESNSSTQRPAIFLQHGLLCSSSVWLLNLPDQSPGFVFADRGLDVWMGNMRGNTYSKKHVRMSSDSSDFWKFTWEQMSEYDLPAMIDYVLNETKQTSLNYVGHSQGTLTMLARLSKEKDFAKKIRKFFSLAPVSRLSEVQGAFYYLGFIYESYKETYRRFGDSEVLPESTLTSLLIGIVCDKSSLHSECEELLFFVSGPDSNQYNSSRIGVYLSHNPAGTSTRNMVHYSQMIHTKQMASFDLGPEGNMRQYGQVDPPEYDLTNVHCDTYLYYSDYDWIATPTDVEGFLIKTLPKDSIKLTSRLKEFNHNDFVFGFRARKEIYDPIADIINT
ncbi:unnamed protein product [Nippostrongylus brasiliensis]|uniref:Lipase n=1 Tax=Nippostrongylus brasiliensis TaxID=27835 RepID=A0A0N4XZC7_NIPBR|nr:unnamed protein product [Nippostrongylus brasiliensis]